MRAQIVHERRPDLEQVDDGCATWLMELAKKMSQARQSQAAKERETPT